MITKIGIVIIGWIALFISLIQAYAQAPISIAGDTFMAQITSGINPFGNYGCYLWITANSGNTGQSIGIYGVSGGCNSTYTYTPTSASTANISMNDNCYGALNISATFLSSSSGSYRMTANSYPGAYEDGVFYTIASYNAPSSIAGKTVICSIASASYPFYTYGSYTLTISASGTAYTTSSGDSGTCSYSLANRSTGKLQLTSALIGSFVAYFGYTDALHGGFATTQSSSGGYQVGTFTQLDTTLPTLTITAPTAGQRWSNSVFKVTGTANDDTQVSQVYYQIFGAGFNLATSTNGWTNWSGNISLSTIGTNIIQAYSVDSSGNHSSISSQTIVYVVTAVATVQTNGNGSISPNYNGQLLEIGKNYSMTATPSPGFGFVNWTGSVTTNNATVQFVMASNLTLTANFVDVAKPTNIITSPTAGQSWSNQVFTILGAASDNIAVTNVYYQLNGNGWSSAPTTNKWTNWSATVLLQPSNNVLQAYAVDASGNLSTTSSVSFTYVVSDTLRIQTTGKGTISPNYSNAVLQIGKSYGMTATAAVGFTFTNWVISTNWTGGVISNNATLNFVMQSNLTIQANFADTTKPTNTITTPISGQRWSNALFNVTGTAGDNVQVSNVWYQVNGLGWNSATNVNNWSNWTAQVTLAPGTNSIAAYSVDTSGNTSTTNNVSFQYVVTNQLQLFITGLGSITPSNTWLEIGRNYSITSTPAAGFRFTNWTGSLTANTAALNFMMASNLTFTANFIDTNKPTLSITNLVGGQRWSNAIFTVRGTATDNWQVASVQYQLNGLTWSNATSTNAWTNWYATLNLVPGTNTLAAYATDSSGNVSAATNFNFQFVVTNQLQIRTTGKGTLSPNYSNSWLEIGRNYSITSAPATGFMFTNWTISTNWVGGATVAGTNLLLMIQSNLTLLATFVETSRPTLTITAPTNNQKMTNALVTGIGTASDNWQITNIWYQLNSNAWNQVSTANSFSNWNTPLLTLVTGTNTLKAFALNLGGIYSLTNSVSFVSSNTFALQLVFTNALPMKTNGLVFSLQLSSGLNGRIQFSTNMADWTPLTNFVGTNSTITFRDPGATNSSQRFYRAVIP